MGGQSHCSQSAFFWRMSLTGLWSGTDMTHPAFSYFLANGLSAPQSLGLTLRPCSICRWFPALFYLVVLLYVSL